MSIEHLFWCEPVLIHPWYALVASVRHGEKVELSGNILDDFDSVSNKFLGKPLSENYFSKDKKVQNRFESISIVNGWTLLLVFNLRGHFWEYIVSSWAIFWSEIFKWNKWPILYKRTLVIFPNQMYSSQVKQYLCVWNWKRCPWIFIRCEISLIQKCLTFFSLAYFNSLFQQLQEDG